MDTHRGPVLGRSVRVAVVGAEEELHPLLLAALGGALAEPPVERAVRRQLEGNFATLKDILESRG